jgi:hydrogenase maturation factor
VSLDQERCLTCSDEAVAVTVVAVQGPNATVEAEGKREQVGIELVGPVEPGDTLLCHAGIALEKLS